MSFSSWPEVLAALAEHPDDVGLKRVCADRLLELNHPRGELMRLQLAGDDAAAEKYVDQNWDALLGPLGRVLVPGAVKFRHGLLDEISLGLPGAQQSDWDAARSHLELRFVRKVVQHYVWPPPLRRFCSAGLTRVPAWSVTAGEPLEFVLDEAANVRWLRIWSHLSGRFLDRLGRANELPGLEWVGFSLAQVQSSVQLAAIARRPALRTIALDFAALGADAAARAISLAIGLTRGKASLAVHTHLKSGVISSVARDGALSIAIVTRDAGEATAVLGQLRAGPFERVAVEVEALSAEQRAGLEVQLARVQASERVLR